jgi:hypothetical protein
MILFFEAQRRHIAWEETVLLPLAQRRLDGEARAAFAVALLRHRLGQDRPALGAIFEAGGTVGCGHGCPDRACRSDPA